MSTAARALGLAQAHAVSWVGMLGDYYELGKPRIMYLLLVTTGAAMLMAARGFPPAALLGWTMLGGALAAMSAGALNCVYDKDIDAVMRRTSARPVPSGRISVLAATSHACVMGVLSFAVFYFRVNPLAAWLSLAGNVFYVVIYTMWLKRRTPQNIVIGGAAGAIPPLVGWAAVTHGIAAPALALFGVIFLWTPPHFWALALTIESDYEKARIPMLPNVAGERAARHAIFAYSLTLVGFSLLLYPAHIMGLGYFAVALVLGGIFVRLAWKTRTDATNRCARALFRYSLAYLALLCVAMVADRILR